MTRGAWWLLVAAAGCKGKGDETGAVDDTGEAWRPDLVCPGDPGCETNEGPLEAGAAAEPITPTCFESWEDLDGNGEYDSSTEAFLDCGCDRLCEGDEGWPGPDEGEGDGEFQAVWIAGFGTGRPAASVHDDQWARAVALRTGDTTVAIVALDLVGWFWDDTVRVREAIASRGVDVDHVIVHATHVHEAVDVLGQWGSRVGQTGRDPDYVQYVIDQAATAVEEAVDALQPATMTVAAVDTAAPFGDKGTWNTVHDSRDPVIIDQDLYTARFADSDGQTIATLVNWGNHPEVLGSENTALTSDYVHYVREAVENGVNYDSYQVPGVGGVCVFINASVGGLMTPLHITVTDGEGNEFSDTGFDKAQALGRVIGELALQGIDEAVPAEDPTISVRALSYYVPMENVLFQAAYLMGIFDRQAYNYDPDVPFDETNVPELRTEVDALWVGPVGMLTVPGELAPEEAIGGYDGSRVNTDQDEFIDPDNPNPPDVSQAPAGPYFKDLLGAEYNWIIGLGNDEIGYLIPAYDYQLDEALPYIEQAEGDHYEETNSVGPQATPKLEEAVSRLLGWEG